MKATFKNLYESTVPYSWRENLYRTTKLKYHQILTVSNNQDRLLADFDRYKCIFVHIPKTGGMSIRNSLFDRSYLPPHLTIRDYQALLSEKKVDSYYKFAFVRNPWDRMVSAYSFLKAGGLGRRGKQWSIHLSQYENFDCFVKEWLNDRNIQKHIVLVPQFQFICNRNREIAVDYLAHFEQFECDFNRIQTKLDTNYQLRHVNKSQRHNYRDYYTDESREIVAQVYAKDIEYFNYRFD